MTSDLEMMLAWRCAAEKRALMRETTPRASADLPRATTCVPSNVDSLWRTAARSVTPSVPLPDVTQS